MTAWGSQEATSKGALETAWPTAASPCVHRLRDEKGMGVKVTKQHSFSCFVQRSGEIYSSCGFTHAAFLIHHSNYLSHSVSFLFVSRETIFCKVAFGCFT